MEQFRATPEKNYHEHSYLSPEQIALEALVDRIIEDSDKRYFEMFNRMLDRTHEDNGEA